MTYNYIGNAFFTDRDNWTYSVNFYAKQAREFKSVVMGETPIIHKREGDYIRGGVESDYMTMQLASTPETRDWILSLASSDPMGVSISITKMLDGRNSSKLWQGFLSNETYSQDWTAENEIIELEFVGMLSVAKMYPYTLTGMQSLSATLSTFFGIYDPNQAPELWISELISDPAYNLCVHSSNWVDETDEPSTYWDVLDEWARFFGVVLRMDYAQTLSRCMMDNPIRQEFASGYKLYNRADKYTTYKVQSAPIFVRPIKATDYAGTGGTLSINPSIDRIKVTNSLYEVDGVYPVFDQSNSTLNTRITTTSKGRTSENRFYGAPQWTTIRRTWNGSSWIAVDPIPPRDGYDPMESFGSMLNKYAEYESVTNGAGAAYDWCLFIHSGIHKGAQLSPKTTVMLKYDYSWKGSADYTSPKRTPMMLAISAELLGSSAFDRVTSTVSTDSHYNGFVLPIQIKIGSQYYDNVAGTWGRSGIWSHLVYEAPDRGVEITDQWLACRDGFANDPLYDLKGLRVPLTSTAMVSNIELRIGIPYYATNVDNRQEHPRANEIVFWWLKNLKVDYGYPDSNTYPKDYLKESKQDRVVEYIAETDWTGNEENVSLNLSSAQDGKLARSFVYRKTGSDYLPIGTKYEEQLIGHMAKQLGAPAKELSLDLLYIDKMVVEVDGNYKLVEQNDRLISEFTSGADYCIYSEEIEYKWLSNKIKGLEVKW